MVSKVAEDPGLSPRVRRRATALQPVAHSDPALARQLLADLADEVRTALTRSPPTSDLCRVVSVSMYFTHHLSDDARAYYLSNDEYLAHLRSVDAERIAHRSLHGRDPVSSASFLVGCLPRYRRFRWTGSEEGTRPPREPPICSLRTLANKSDRCRGNSPPGKIC